MRPSETFSKNHLLSDLLKGVTIDQTIGNTDVQIKDINYDSRNVSDRSVFVAIRGTNLDGHNYIEQAITLGCKVVVCEQLPDNLPNEVTFVLVPDSSLALGLMASNFYDNPSSHLSLVAVTGTNGKTSTVHLLSGLFDKLGYKVGMLSTINNRVDTEFFPSSLTTPDPLTINKLLNDMVVRGCQYCFMEASSHAINQKRIAGLTFAGAIFLNITHDHLDYHKTFNDYIKAKKKLFDDLPSKSFALINVDDKRGQVMLQNTKARKKCAFALKSSAEFTAKLISNTMQGLELRIDNQVAWFQLVGEFNAYNILAAYGAACLLGQHSHDVLTALSSIAPIKGRFQCVQAPKGFYAIVDYAHTPDAMVNVLKTIMKVKTKTSQVITVIGCGGNRDKTKRPLMAQTACEFSNKVIFTTDNPRYENPDAIAQEMKAGLSETQNQKTLYIPDRAEAIKAACQFANPNDVILIAGKGHENYQEVEGVRKPFCDFEVLKGIFNAKK